MRVNKEKFMFVHVNGLKFIKISAQSVRIGSWNFGLFFSLLDPGPGSKSYSHNADPCEWWFGSASPLWAHWSWQLHRQTGSYNYPAGGGLTNTWGPITQSRTVLRRWTAGWSSKTHCSVICYLFDNHRVELDQLWQGSRHLQKKWQNFIWYFYIKNY